MSAPVLSFRGPAWHRLLGEVAGAAQALPPPPEPAAPAYVIDTNPTDGIRTMMALMLAGYSPVLGSKPHHREETGHPAYAWPDLPATIGATIDPRGYPDVSRLGPAPTFCTSGSTGDGTLVRKSWAPLLLEAAFLHGLTQLQPGSLVVALVPPFHIFGFLYGVLLPCLAGADVVFPAYDAGVLALPEALLADADLVITVPAIWPALKALLPAADLPLVVSSGAPWDAVREAEFLELKTKAELRTRLFDVLGSTETGGLGFRELGVSPGAVFSAFAGVELALAPGGGFRLRSPYTEPPLEWTTLADDFVVDPADKRFFVYKGRRDRVFKLGGQRFSLAEIERHLTEILAGAAVRCRFREDAALPKGGELLAYVATEALDYAAVRRAYLSRYQTPFPSRIFLVDAFRPNAAGKLSLPELEAQALAIIP